MKTCSNLEVLPALAAVKVLRWPHNTGVCPFTVRVHKMELEQRERETHA